jgi:hypothetical protein
VAVNRGVSQGCVEQLANRPNVIGYPQGHCGRDPQRFMDPTQIVVRHEQCHGGSVVFELLAKAVGQPGEPIPHKVFESEYQSGLPFELSSSTPALSDGIHVSVARRLERDENKGRVKANFENIARATSSNAPPGSADMVPSRKSKTRNSHPAWV